MPTSSSTSDYQRQFRCAVLAESETLPCNFCPVFDVPLHPDVRAVPALSLTSAAYILEWNVTNEDPPVSLFFSLTYCPQD